MNGYAALFFLPGLLLGGWHFGTLHWLSRQLVDTRGRPRWGRMLTLHLLRLAVLVLACVWAVRQGALPLLALILGLLLARLLVQRWLRPQAEDQP